MRRPYARDRSTVIVFAISVFGATKLDQQFFPASDRPELTVAIRLPENSPFYATERAVDEIEKFLAQDPTCCAGATTSVPARCASICRSSLRCPMCTSPPPSS